MKSIEDAIKSAEKIAVDESHGYDQQNRNGPNYDCSSLMRKILMDGGFPVQFTYTGNMRDDLIKMGFKEIEGKRLDTSADLVRGDILLFHNYITGNGHTAIYIGDNKIIHASSNEFGGITGGQTGDQTGKEICIAKYFNYPWSYVFRYVEDTTNEKYFYYTVKKNDTIWAISREYNVSIDDICTLNHIVNPALIKIGQILKIPKNTNEEVKPPQEIDTIKITIEGNKIKDCTYTGNTIIIYIGE